MLKMLRTLCILLKVLMLTRAALLEDLWNRHTSTLKIIGHNVESVQNYYGPMTKIVVLRKVLPSEPTSLRAFVEFYYRLNEEFNIIVTFRWKQPKFKRDGIRNYMIKFWLSGDNNDILDVKEISATGMEHKIENSKPDTIYYYQVCASDETINHGPYTEIFNVSTTHENPVPLLLISSWSGMKVFDVDLQIDFALNEYRAKEIAYSALERKIYWINDKSELMTWDFNPNAIERERNYTKIADLDTSAHNLCIDWITRNLYWIEFSNQTSNIMKLDLTLWQQSGTKNK